MSQIAIDGPSMMLVKLELVCETVANYRDGSDTLLTERPRIGGA
jgi:hypothetical protein